VAPRSHGSGAFTREQLKRCPDSVILEPGVLVFHPENISLDEEVYVGHYAILKGYFKNELIVGRGSWIGQACFLHAGGGITIGEGVGVGPHVCILTSTHDAAPGRPIMSGPIEFAPVVLEDGCDIGVGAILLPGVTVGKNAQVGAGAVVTRSVAPNTTVVGNPAKPR